MNSLEQGITLELEHWTLMEAEVREKEPEEACGIVAGEGNHSRFVFPITNIFHSPTKFRMDPKEELNAFYCAEEQGLDILAVYHSHPYGIGQPSLTDQSELSFPGIIYLIWYKVIDEWRCRGFLMHMQGNTIEVPVKIISK